MTHRLRGIFILTAIGRPFRVGVGVISRLPDRRLAAAGAKHRLRQAGAALSRAMRPFGKRPPERLIIAPQDLRTSDPTIADEIYAGHIKLAGKVLETHGRSPFDLPPPSEAFAAELHDFSWLRHLRAAETPLSRANGRALVGDWMALGRARPAIAMRPEVAARRLISWMSHTPLLLEGADAGFYRAFVKCVTQEATRLGRRTRGVPPDETRLLMRVALMHHALAALDNDRGIRNAAERLCELLDRQILPDGGHVSRNPQVLLHLLLDLLPLKLAFISRRIQTPRPVMSAIDRMTPMLRMMRHGDGGVALFHGMGPTRADLVAAVLALDDVLAAPPMQAPYSGYQRAEAGGAVLIVDCAPPPAPPLAGRAHAAPAAFEISVENHRLVVNCGVAPASRPDLQPFGRVTAAHSTLVVAEQTIGRFRRSRIGGKDLGEQYVGGATDVALERQDSAEGVSLTVSHNGWRRFKLRHRRKLALAGDGLMLAGEDALKPSRRKLTDQPYELRFHLHPGVRPALSEDRRTAWLRLPNRSVWTFEASGAELALEDSLFFASPEGARRTSQIVIRSRIATQASIAWTFRKSGNS
jgi:uncharacterized heparinase superfamily protein